MDLETDKKIIKIITEKRTISKSFSKIINEFDDKFSNFNLINNCFDLADYFHEGSGQVTATKKLIEDGRIQKNWLRKYKTKSGKTKTDFKGLYVFLIDKTPFYVGISKGVIGRVIQHIKGHNHNTSSLAYKIGLKRFELLSGNKYKGSRKELNFKTEVEPVKDFLSRQKIAWLNIDNDEELFLFEVYCSMKLRTILNDFETH
tara:strand:+ start:1273 stop:1878 length:606 start_codon:yes stop_codon:yes gene_type:complete